MNLSKIKFEINTKSKDLEQIDLVIKELGCTVPRIYYEFLNIMDGFTDENCVVLYGVEDLIERNETWEVEEYANGYVAIGDDSGGNVFLMKCEEKAKEVISVDVGCMNPDECGELITNDFKEWILQGCKLENESEEKL